MKKQCERDSKGDVPRVELVNDVFKTHNGEESNGHGGDACEGKDEQSEEGADRSLRLHEFRRTARVDKGNCGAQRHDGPKLRTTNTENGWS